MPIKILFIVNDLGVGGVQRLVVDFANFLDKQKFAVSVGTLLAREKSFFYRDQLNNDVSFYNFPFKNFYDLRQFFKLYSFVKKNKFDIVFSQLFMADLFGRTAALLARVPVIITEIQNITAGLPKKMIFIDRVLAKFTAACISTTPAITDYAVKIIKFPREKVVEVPTNAVDLRRFEQKFDRAAIRQSLGIPLDAKVIINIGRVVEQKGQKFLIKAAPKVIAEEPKAYFIIVGSGDLEDDLKNEAKNLNISERVIFLGTRIDTPELLAAADVFAFPSVWEGQGLILFEAIFSKIPIVASNVGGIPDIIINEQTGLLAEVGDVTGLAKSILRLLGDSNLRDKLTEEAFLRFNDRTMENSIKKLEQAFIDLLTVKISKK